MFSSLSHTLLPFISIATQLLHIRSVHPVFLRILLSYIKVSRFNHFFLPFPSKPSYHPNTIAFVNLYFLLRTTYPFLSKTLFPIFRLTLFTPRQLTSCTQSLIIRTSDFIFAKILRVREWCVIFNTEEIQVENISQFLHCEHNGILEES